VKLRNCLNFIHEYYSDNCHGLKPVEYSYELNRALAQIQGQFWLKPYIFIEFYPRAKARGKNYSKSINSILHSSLEVKNN
jgi:hypothetical protein